MSFFEGIADADLVNISFSSQFRYEHIAQRPDGSFLKGHIIIPSTNTPVVIAHNLGYVPYVKVQYKFTIGGKTYMLPALSTPQSYVQVEWTPDEEFLTINAFNNYNWDGTPGTLFNNLPVYYRIYAEPVKV